MKNVSYVLIAIMAMIVGWFAMGPRKSTAPVQTDVPSVVAVPAPPATPTDLALIAGGSSWTCRVSAAQPQNDRQVDYRFSASTEGSRWESYSQRGLSHPFFDLDHAAAMDEYFSGSYSVDATTIKLTSDHAGRPLSFSPTHAQYIESALRAGRATMRGKVAITPQSNPIVVEALNVRSISANQMTAVGELFGDTAKASRPLTCSRIDERPLVQ